MFRSYLNETKNIFHVRTGLQNPIMDFPDESSCLSKALENHKTNIFPITVLLKSKLKSCNFGLTLSASK